MANIMATLIWITLMGNIVIIGAIALYTIVLIVKCKSKEEVIENLEDLL